MKAMLAEQQPTPRPELTACVVPVPVVSLPRLTLAGSYHSPEQPENMRNVAA